MSRDKLAAWEAFDARRRTAYLSGDEDAKASGAQMMTNLLGQAKALYWAHWTAHWRARGYNYYGDHLLFERMKNGMADELDTIAEKGVGYFGSRVVDIPVVMEGEHAGMATMPDGGSDIEKLLAMEQSFQALVKQTYETMKASGMMPLGLDDFLMALSSAHDTNVYLLQQRLGDLLT